mgnify:CR=1 FL=1
MVHTLKSCHLKPWKTYEYRAADINAGWSSPVARQAHNLKVVGSNPTPATNNKIQKAARKKAALIMLVGEYKKGENYGNKIMGATYIGENAKGYAGIGRIKFGI